MAAHLIDILTPDELLKVIRHGGVADVELDRRAVVRYIPAMRELIESALQHLDEETRTDHLATAMTILTAVERALRLQRRS